jgi:hypothetical protein
VRVIFVGDDWAEGQHDVEVQDETGGGILHGCLKTRTLYDETTAWAHHTGTDQKAAA